MDNINKILERLAGIASNPELGAGIGANDPLAAGVGLPGSGMMSDMSSSGGNPAMQFDVSVADMQLPSFSFPDVEVPSVSVPDSDQAAPPEEKFDYSKMLESLSKEKNKLASSQNSAAPAPAARINRGAAPSGGAPMMYGNMTGVSPGMQAIKNNQPMIGGQPSIEQILQSLAR